MSPVRAVLLGTAALGLAACAAFNGGEPRSPYGATLGDLQKRPVAVPAELTPVPLPSIELIEDSYRAALEVAIDPDVRHRVLIRLGDLEMARSEQRQINATEQRQFFSDAIAMYQELLVLNSERQGQPGTPSNERLLYQLSKAYALDGRIDESNAVLEQLVAEFPESPYVAEAEFRRAEKSFSDGDYQRAEALYQQVVANGADTPFYGNAVYMRGWAQFKRARYRAAIGSFTEVLDRILIEGRDEVDYSNSERNLANDTLRIISIAFSYLDGAQTITEVYAKLGERHYQHRLYERLGDLYLEKRRYSDSAETYRHYVQHYPNSDPAPLLSVKAIEVYKLGGFPAMILPAKEEYVRSYGARSQFWAERDAVRRQPIVANLALFLDELSSYHHANALELRKAQARFQQQKAQGKKPKDKPPAAEPVFLKAAALYDEFEFTFPQNQKAPEMAYLKGEAYYEAGYLAEAVDAYESVAYSYLDPTRGPDAGYSAVVSLQRLIEQSATGDKPVEQRAQWQSRKITSALNYADYYGQDKRAVAVLTQAAQEIFAGGDFERATEVATRVTNWQPPPEPALYKTAGLIVAHSQFDLQNYPRAEAAYRTVLAQLGPNDPDRAQVVERIAAAIYKQTETQIAAGELEPAVARLLSVRDIAPGTEIAISAQYDAANYLIELKQWSRAEAELLDFQRRFPEHKLAATLPPKFALIYQESEQWDKAALTLAGMANSDPSPDVRRQSLYLSAELFSKVGRRAEAINQYRDYVARYPAPFDLATEARFHLVELYGESGEGDKRDVWLNKLIEADASAGGARSDRSKYLAAFATSKFAGDQFQRYSAVQLTLPLKKSLKTKRAALDKTLDAYKAVLAYGVAEFSTEANHKIGTIYKQLSKDLMNSQRPKGLDELALEQYEILLEEQAFPFEEKAIAILAANAERAWEGIYDKWVKQSFAALAELLPARYGKMEKSVEVSDALF